MDASRLTPPTLMIFRREFRGGLVGALTAWVTVAPVKALISLNAGHDHIFVTGSVGVSHDSNVFANNEARSDFLFNSSLQADYTRRAGWIGLDAGVRIDSSRFAEIDGEDFANPSFNLNLLKQTGRTTGTLAVTAARESRADPSLSTRTSSWNYTTDLNLKYPVVKRLALAPQLGYAQREYVDEEAFANLSTYHAGMDLYYILTSDRDAIAGYRYRSGQTSRDTGFVDHSFTTGINGRIIRRINGGIRAGYQVRVPNGIASGEANFGSWTASGVLTYPLNKKTSFSGRISKDFSTTATDEYVDNTAASLDVQYAYSSRWSASAGIGWGNSRFLGDRARGVMSPESPEILGPQRHDDYINGNVTLDYSLNEHFKFSLSHLWFKNWSTSTVADFVRSNWSFNVVSRW